MPSEYVQVPDAPAFGPLGIVNVTVAPDAGLPPWLIVAVTASLVPTGLDAVVGDSEMSGAVAVTSPPASRMYDSPHAVVLVLGSVPHVGWLGVSVATASAFQSAGNSGNVM